MMPAPIQSQVHLLSSPFIMAQKMEHKNILWKVKCSVLNAEDLEEAMKRGQSEQGWVSSDMEFWIFFPFITIVQIRLCDTTFNIKRETEQQIGKDDFFLGVPIKYITRRGSL